MLTNIDIECHTEEGRIQCDSERNKAISIGSNVPDDRAMEVEQKFQNRQRLANEDRGYIQNWLNEPKLDECYSKYKRSDGEINREFVCVEKHRKEQLKKGAKEVGKTFTPSL